VNQRFDKGAGKKGRGKGKGKSQFAGPGSLAKRIANSFCRICMQKGHWKNECPQKGTASSHASANSSTASVAPTSVVTIDDAPAEIANFTIVEGEDPVDEQPCFTAMNYHWGYNQGNRGKIKGISHKFAQRFHSRWKTAIRTKISSEKIVHPTAMPAPCPETTVAGQLPIVRKSPPAKVLNDQTCDVHFATTGAVGIVDLGASQTVIGAQQVKDLIGSLPQHVQSQIQRTSCNLTFRFGNHQTLTSRHAIVLPLGQAKFRIAIVPGKTPFLLSSSFLKGIQAIIDADQGTIWSKRLNKELHVERSSKNLFLMDICQLWADPNDAQPVQESDAAGFTCHPVITENTESRSEMHHDTHTIHCHMHQVRKVRSPKVQHTLRVQGLTFFNPEVVSIRIETASLLFFFNNIIEKNQYWFQ
jgi:hypothetical protein